MKDIYFEPKYGKLYEKVEQGTCEVFEFNSSIGSIHHMFIKREIPIHINDTSYFDLVTPYGYGGPLVTKCKEGLKDELIKEFKQAFQKYCEKNNIVSEFVRFHPVVGNAADFCSVYEVENIRKTIGTNIHTYEDPIDSEFSKSARKTIRRVLNSGVSYKVTEKPNLHDISRFKEVYYSTMDRKDASDYYYFSEQYFEECIENFKDNIILIEVMFGDKVIASAFYFVYNKIIHAHLSGTLRDYLNLSPAYIIKYATAIWAKENNTNLIHYGGGTSNSTEDPLYKFKKKFGKNTEFDFYIGKKVWEPVIYKELCKKKEVDINQDFFPAYRLESKNEEATVN